MSGTQIKFHYLFIFIVLLAFVLRFYDLGYKVFNWDEAVHAWLVRSLLETGQYSYSPVYHGPFQFYAGAAAFSLFGISEAAGRIFPAMAGMLIIALLYLLRDIIGKKAVIISSLMIAISPFFVYYSRFMREDIYFALFTLAIFVFGLLYFKKKDQKYLILSAASLGLSMAAKESTAITAVIFTAFLMFFVAKRRNSKIINEYWKPAMLFFGVAAIVTAAFYTAFFMKPENFLGSVYKGVEYWVGKHQNPNLGGPWYFYLLRMWLYEPAVLVFGLLGAAAYIRHRNPAYQFIAYWSAASLIVYSIVQEKMPWLALHVILPFAMLSGLYISERIDFGKINRMTIIVAAFLLISLIGGVRVNFIQPMNAVEPVMYAQTVPDVRNAVSLLKSNLPESAELQILHKQGEGLSSPLYWYLWDYRNKVYLAEETSKANSKAVFSVSLNETVREAMKANYAEHKFYTWGYYNHEANPLKFFSPAFYLYRIDSDTGSEQGIFYIYLKSGNA